jgi:hypothetical protein
MTPSSRTLQAETVGESGTPGLAEASAEPEFPSWGGRPPFAAGTLTAADNELELVADRAVP